jgi:hypothetical protein
MSDIFGSSKIFWRNADNHVYWSQRHSGNGHQGAIVGIGIKRGAIEVIYFEVRSELLQVQLVQPEQLLYMLSESGPGSFIVGIVLVRFLSVRSERAMKPPVARIVLHLFQEDQVI